MHLKKKLKNPGIVAAGWQENEFCSEVLNFLESLDVRKRCTHEEIVAIVKP